MTDRFIDFDAAWAEASTDPLRVRLYGQEWELPGVMPAAVPLKIARMMADGREATALTRAETFDLAADIIPRETLDAWTAKGLDVDKLGDVITWVLRMYMGKVDPSGEGPAPEVGAPPSSSNGGGMSPPTSDASTSSTSPGTSPG